MSALDIWKSDRPLSLLESFEPMSRELDRIVRDMDRFFGTRSGWTRPLASGDYLPACDIDESDNEYHIAMDIPGIDKDDIKIEVVGHEIKITGEKKTERHEKGGSEYRHERSFGKFSRTFHLPDGVKEDKIEANYDSGVLSLTLPKNEKTKAQRIEIKPGKPSFLARLSGEKKSKVSNA